MRIFHIRSSGWFKNTSHECRSFSHQKHRCRTILMASGSTYLGSWLEGFWLRVCWFWNQVRNWISTLYRYTDFPFFFNMWSSLPQNLPIDMEGSFVRQDVHQDCKQVEHQPHWHDDLLQRSGYPHRCLAGPFGEVWEQGSRLSQRFGLMVWVPVVSIPFGIPLWKGLLRRGSPNGIPNHAPNHQLTISWQLFSVKDVPLAHQKAELG